MTKVEKIKQVKSICNKKFNGFPPKKDDDEEFVRNPWCLFGSLRFRGNSIEWIWDDTLVIDKLTSYRDVEEAYFEVTTIE